MTALTPVTASFSVGAGTYAEGYLDVTGLRPDEIAELVFDEIAADTSLCHECCEKLSDPEIADLVAFNVGGVEYEKVGHEWVAQS